MNYLFFKKIFFAFFALFVSTSFSFAQEEGVIGTDAPANFGWKKPTPKEAEFRLIALDQKPYTLYIKKDSFFAPVSVAGRSLSQMYPINPTDELVFFIRKQMPELPKGQSMYIPVGKLQLNKCMDSIVAVYVAGGKLGVSFIDISLSKMPIGSITFVNIYPSTLSVSLGKIPFRLDFMQTKQFAGVSSDNGLKQNNFTLKTYNTLKGKLDEVSSDGYTFWSDERMIVMIYEQKKKIDHSKNIQIDPSLGGTYVAYKNSINMVDKGPRRN